MNGYGVCRLRHVLELSKESVTVGEIPAGSGVETMAMLVTEATYGAFLFVVL